MNTVIRKPLGVRPDVKDGAGFTLVELLAVITIMAIMSLIAVVSVPRLVKAREVTTATHALLGAINHAQQVAIVRGTKTRVTFGARRAADASTFNYNYSNLTNAVRVFYKDMQLNADYTGWVIDDGYHDVRVLGRMISVGIEGGSQSEIREYYLHSWDFSYTNMSGVVKSFPFSELLETKGESWYGVVITPYLEFDAMGRACHDATVTVMSVASTNVAVSASGAQYGAASKSQGNWHRLVITKGEKRITME